MSRILLQLLTLTLLLGLLTGCESLRKDKKKRDEAAQVKDMPDQSGDVAFQSFVGRLRKAVENRDMHVLASMMTPNFGYLLEPRGDFPGEGPGVFKYWDEMGLWPELRMIVHERWAPKGNYMVSPPEFASNPNYSGYRAGITRVGGSWKFVYFVTDAPSQ